MRPDQQIELGTLNASILVPPKELRVETFNFDSISAQNKTTLKSLPCKSIMHLYLKTKNNSFVINLHLLFSQFTLHHSIIIKVRSVLNNLVRCHPIFKFLLDRFLSRSIVRFEHHPLDQIFTHLHSVQKFTKVTRSLQRAWVVHILLALFGHPNVLKYGDRDPQYVEGETQKLL